MRSLGIRQPIRPAHMRKADDMTLRQYYAGQALASSQAQFPRPWPGSSDQWLKDEDDENAHLEARIEARRAFFIADAMIEFEANEGGEA